MADPSVVELTFDSVKDFMVYRGGRLTNHELVKHFKLCLTNTENKEFARNKFKQFVNTLSNISQEGGEKYLVLKRKYRVGTHLQVDEYPSPLPGSQPQFPTPSQYAGPTSPSTPQSPEAISPAFPPPYRAPPPYRPPPEPMLSPQALREDLMNRELRTQASSYQITGPRFQSPLVAPPQDDFDPSLKAVELPRRGSFQHPHDLGIPPPPPSMHRTSSSNSLVSSCSSLSSSSHSKPAIPPYNPNRSLSSSASGSPLVSFHEGERRNFEGSFSVDTNSISASRSSLANSVSTASVSSLEDIPVVPPRRRNSNNKENFCPPSEVEQKFSKVTIVEPGHDGAESAGDRTSVASVEDERKVSVRETTQKFNKMASESQLPSGRANGKSARSSRFDRDDDDSPSIKSFGSEGVEWLVAAARSDFSEILRLLKIHPGLARYRDTANYTALHWAAKHGRTEVIKLLCGTYNVDVNAKSNGGYTPLHLAAIYHRHDTFTLLTHHGANLNLRDYSGKKPRQYQATASSTLSQDAQKRIVRRRNSLKEAGGFLRIGSLNVKVRKRSEVLNNLIARDAVEARLHRAWGSSDSLPETGKDSKMMPPPKFGPMKKRKTKDKKEGVSRTSPTTPVVTPTSVRIENSMSHSLPSVYQDSDSDSAYGFGSDWSQQ